MLVKPFAAFILLFLLVACHGGENDFSLKFEYTGMSVENAHNLGELPVPTLQDSIPATAYVIRVNLQHEILADGNATADYDHPPQNLNHIDSISITSNNQFDFVHPAGTSLNSKFYYFNDSYFSTYSLDNMAITNMNKDDYAENPIPEYLDLMLNQVPINPSVHQFTVQIFLVDGTVFTDTTQAITLY